MSGAARDEDDLRVVNDGRSVEVRVHVEVVEPVPREFDEALVSNIFWDDERDGWVMTLTIPDDTD